MRNAKRALRQHAMARRAEAAASNPSAGDALAQHAAHIATPRCVAAYRPIRNEIDPLPLARALVARGASLALPVVDGGAIHFCAWREGEPLRKGKFGIEEPMGPKVSPDLLLVPLLAFTRQGDRLGYGAGHYDCYIASHPDITTIGVAFAAQEVQDLPIEDHDQALSLIVTEKTWIAPREATCG
ncbi:MAG: 5-formyltetrahydrofolate cyclo-ligase [Pseudomonadota bacterium]